MKIECNYCVSKFLLFDYQTQLSNPLICSLQSFKRLSFVWIIHRWFLSFRYELTLSELCPLTDALSSYQNYDFVKYDQNNPS